MQAVTTIGRGVGPVVALTYRATVDVPSFALFGTDGSERIGRGGALIARGAGAAAAYSPAAGDLVFLADAGFVLEPDLYPFACPPAGWRFVPRGRGSFFKAPPSPRR